MILNEIRIYETLNCGSVVKIEKRLKKQQKKIPDDIVSPDTATSSGQNSDNFGEVEDWITVWEGEKEKSLPLQARIFAPPLKITQDITNEIKITLDTSGSESYTELDAIQAIGFPIENKTLKTSKFGDCLLSGYQKAKEILHSTSSPGAENSNLQANFDCSLMINGTSTKNNKQFSSNFKAHWFIITSRIKKSVMQSKRNSEFALNFEFDEEEKNVELTQELFDEICEIYLQFLYSGRIIFSSDRKDFTPVPLMMKILRRLAEQTNMNVLVDFSRQIIKYCPEIAQIMVDETLRYDIFNGYTKLKFERSKHPSPLVLKFASAKPEEESESSEKADKELEILVDPFVASCRSEFFRANLHNLREFSQNYEIIVDPTVSVPGGSEIPLKFEDILCVLEFIFGGIDYEVNNSNSVAVYVLANMWLVTERFTKCENIIIDTMDENSMIFCAGLGYSTKSYRILKAAGARIVSHSSTFKEKDDEDSTDSEDEDAENEEDSQHEDTNDEEEDNPDENEYEDDYEPEENNGADYY